MNRRLSTAEATRIPGRSEARVRERVRRGLGRRGRRYSFSFQDLVILRAAHTLIERDVSAARVARELASLTDALPCDQRAVELAPGFANAHDNLASLCEKLERPRDAPRHDNDHRRLTQSS